MTMTDAPFFPPVPPVRAEPERVAPDTWVIHDVEGTPDDPVRVYLNSMVILGEEPVIVDTGTIANRRRWFDDVFGLVEPEDVRYIFISHDDIDHTGNLPEVLAHCPQATLIGSWSLVGRHSSAMEFPLPRMIWLNDGEHLDLADRRLTLARPPVWDSPVTRGLFDHRSGVYWSVDTFATPVTPELESTVDQLDPEFWRDGMAMFHHNAVAPWLGLVDHDRFVAHVDRVRSLGMTTIVGGHTPIITDRSIDAAFAIVRELPAIPAPPVPDQSALDALLAEIHAPAA